MSATTTDLGIAFRPATAADADRIHAMTQAAYAEYTNTGYPSSVLQERAADLQEAIASGRTSALLIEESAGATVGSVRYRFIEGDCLYFFRLGLLPEARGRGIARQVIDHLERLARNQGFTRIRCQVRVAVPRNYHLYESAGFERIGEETARRGDADVIIATMEKRL